MQKNSIFVLDKHMAEQLISGYNFARRTGRVGLASSLMARYRQARNTFFGGRNAVPRYSARARLTRQKAGRSRTVTKRRKRVRSGLGVTNQYDAKLVYMKSSMPRGKKRGWKNFIGKVKAAAERDLGTQTALFNRNLIATNSTIGNQIVTDFGLYGLGSTDFFYQDLKAIGVSVGAADQTVAKGLAVGPSTKVIFKSAVLDVTFRNASTRNIAGTQTYVSEAKMEVDVYEISMRQDAVDVSTGNFNNFRGMLDTNASETLGVGGSANEIQRATRGSTPFDFVYTLSRYGVKIWKKTKYMLNNNESFTYQVRDPRRRVCTWKELTDEGGWNKPGWTRVIFVIAKLNPGLIVGTGTDEYTEVLSVGVTRKYSYKIENYTEDRTVVYT